MAVLTSENYGELRQTIFQLGLGKEELKALPTLPSKTQMIAAFQAIETRFVGQFNNFKADIDTALGVNTSQALAKKILAAYLTWKLKNV